MSREKSEPPAGGGNQRPESANQDNCSNTKCPGQVGVVENILAALGRFDISELQSPDWSDRFTGWAYYVDEYLQAVWDELSLEAKLVCVIEAMKAKDRDHLGW